MTALGRRCKPLNIIPQEALLVGEIEIHDGQSPRICFAMMLRWISFDPP